MVASTALSVLAPGALGTFLDVLDIFSLLVGSGATPRTTDTPPPKQPLNGPASRTPPPKRIAPWRMPERFDDSAVFKDEFGNGLSDNLWNARAETRRNIESSIRSGILGGKPYDAIARDLEQYLVSGYRPQRDRRGRIVEDGRKGVIVRTGRGRGSYPARRLARTEVTRAQADSQHYVALRNPLVRGLRWRLASRHKDTDRCDTNSHIDIIEPGGLPKPPDHPFCLCSLYLVYKSDNQTGEVIGQLKITIDLVGKGGLPTPTVPTPHPVTPALQEPPATTRPFESAHINDTPENALLIDRLNQSSTELDDIMDAGGIMQRRVDAKVLEHPTGGLRIARIRELDAEMKEVNKLMKPIYDEMDAAELIGDRAAVRDAAERADDVGNRWTKLRREQNQLENELAALSVDPREWARGQVLREVRDTGRTHGNLYDVVRPDGYKPMFNSYQGEQDAADIWNAIRDVENKYPRNWINTADAAQPEMVLGRLDRGYYSARTSLNEADHFVVSGLDGDARASVALHELGHRMEHYVPSVRLFEQEFYLRRTQNEAFFHIYGPDAGTRYVPNHIQGGDELTISSYEIHSQQLEIYRRDKFKNPYMGKYYGQGRPFELLTMAQQARVTRGSGFTFKLEDDAEMEQWLLGMLASVP